MAADELDFQKIYADFRPRILRYLTGLVGEFEAEDLTQEVFVRVSQALPGFRGEAHLSTWIYRIATNTAFDRLRQASYQRAAPQALPDDPDTGEQLLDQDIWTGEAPPSLEQCLHQKQRFECFCDYLEKLPENYRLIVALSQLEDFTAKEIAEILGLSVDVVKIRLHRGRVWLLEELKTHCKPEDWL
jgi:RNA polymerase sigma-70 factor (ECF subfamily)